MSAICLFSSRQLGGGLCQLGVQSLCVLFLQRQVCGELLFSELRVFQLLFPLLQQQGRLLGFFSLSADVFLKICDLLL